MPDIARVLTDIALDRTFDYEIPPEMRDRIQLGHRVRVPFGGRECWGFVIAFPEVAGHSRLKPVSALHSDTPLIPSTLVQLASWMATYYLCPLEKAMTGILPESVRNTDSSFKTLIYAHLENLPDAVQMQALRKKAPKQAEALETLTTTGPLPVTDLVARGIPRQALQALTRKGWVSLQDQTVEREPESSGLFAESAPTTLTDEQVVALDRVMAEMSKPEPAPVLLHGVTGSGKTEVYLRAIGDALARGKSAIVLVPEISLTPQSVDRFRSRFSRLAGGIAVLHSNLSAGERHDQWHKIRAGTSRLVIGARSAVFAPVQNLGIIVVDEEHEPGYKQQDAPRYHARDVAVVRGRMEHAAVLLGSATPSLETWHNAKSGKYGLTSLTCRVDSQQMPTLFVVDMRREKQGPGGAVISRKLHEAVLQRLEKGEQTILFINRRGFASSLLCTACGHTVTCQHCSVPLTYHRTGQRMACHLCGHTEPAPTKCPACGDPKIRFGSAGTQKVELTISKLFPKASLARVDSDTMSKKGAYTGMLSAFKTGKIDILVGTQMIAKGLHFPNVTLVGVIHADLALGLPDFRASERVFQLLVQVAGRAGRGGIRGEVIVQSYSPGHPAIQYARRHDYHGFVEEELGFRQHYAYPPSLRCVLFTVRARSEEKAEFSARHLEGLLRQAAGAVAEIGAAAPAPIEKMQDWHRWQVFAKTSSMTRFGALARPVLLEARWPEGVWVAADVDPVSLM